MFALGNIYFWMGSACMLDDAGIAAVEEAIYGTALDEEGWPDLLRQMAGVFQCHFADSFRRRVDYSEWHGIQFGLDERDYHDNFLGIWVKANVWGIRRPTRRAGDIVTTREMASVADLKGSDMYLQYLGPRGLHEGLRLDIWAGDGWVEDISLLRRWEDGPYSQRELDAARRLMPHLRRASAIRQRLREKERVAAAGLDALETLRSGILLLDASGRVLHANAAARALLTAGDGLRSGPDGLAAAAQAQTRALQAVIRAAAGRAGEPGRSGSIRLARPSGLPALSLIAIPTASEVRHAPGPGGCAVLACVADPAAVTAISAKHLSGLFGLTPSEAALAGSLLSGLEVREIADRSGRSVHTVRSLLARIMAKTETGRQSDLMRLLTMLPSHVPGGDG